VNVPQPLLLATRNVGKLKELRESLSDLSFELCDLDSLRGVLEIQETGATFIENASLKAAGYATQAGLLTLADDSGLAVDALGGAPGVFSARYGGQGLSDTERTNQLLEELSRLREPGRGARFVSALVIASRKGKILDVSVGTCEGHIAFAPRGSEGFGYDPVFVPLGYEQTFGELKPEIKNRISHRARALAHAREFLRALTTASSAR
jgi:XTP/dITP diphosphohydrolase